MLEIPVEMMIPVAIAAASTAIAGLWDLFTTEVPDEVSAVAIAASLFYWLVYGTATNNFVPLISSLALGTIILVIGWLLYSTGKWGGADALVLAAVFYAIPAYPILSLLSYGTLMFAFNFFMNLVVVSLAYVILYTIVLGIKHRSIIKEFVQDLKKTWKLVVLLPFMVSAGMTALIFINTTMIALPWEIFMVILLLMLFWRYAVVIETKYFIRSVSASSLKEGDVLKQSKKWVGITKEELEKMKKQNAPITIKEGVRFTPVFFLTLAATFIFGNILFYLLLVE